MQQSFEERLKQLKNREKENDSNIDKTINKFDKSIQVLSNTSDILDDLDLKFSKQTGLNSVDIRFLFMAIALQCIRIYVINDITKIERAGKGKLEKELKSIQKDIFSNFERNELLNRPLYASRNQILNSRGVPYDATGFLNEKYDLFNGGNHRFSTLGHDPLLGLIFGTSNILTNTITCIKTPIVMSNHVLYDNELKNPRIAMPVSTISMLNAALERTAEEPSMFVAAFIKQIIHIGTDLFTPCGIQIPLSNLMLSTSNTEKLTKYINTGDIIKVGTSANLAILINNIISVLHMLTYDEKEYDSRELFNVKTRKIIMLSNLIVQSSNVIAVAMKIGTGNSNAIKELDIGGLLVAIYRLINDSKFIREVKNEYIFGQYKNIFLEKTEYLISK